MNTELITRPQFAGHETFPFRFSWLPKAVDLVAEDPEVFGRDDAIVLFGVGKNMVRSIRFWARSCGIIDEVEQTRGRQVKVTQLGKRLFSESGWDRFLEDPATPWLLHWNIASDPDGPTTWHWTFNHAPQLEFTRTQLVTWLATLAQQHDWSRVAETSLKRDVDTFLRCYAPSRVGRNASVEDSIDCPLVDLHLIRELPDAGCFAIVRSEQASLPDEVFTYALLRQLQRRADASRTVPLHTLAFAPGSPGRVFCLTEDALLVRLERVATLTNGNVRFDDTAGLRQMLIDELPDPPVLLQRYYAKKAGRR